ncbi:ferritin [Blattabacterium cuenoti]|uniref:ferritin n=1 Tax=Blattabacterium cuenoti TaxID=1653831 RepID=UPI00163C42C7|nr:ferritin [Blattabacterium cuenoti]
MKEKIKIELVKQLNRELESSHLYLNMASWSENKGFEGVSRFLYNHSDEERFHMLKLMKYINVRGGNGYYIDKNNIIINNNKNKYNNLYELFQILFKHEKSISKNINYLVEVSLIEKDYFTYNFLQWYVEEQMKEEFLCKMILDKIKLVENNRLGLYLFDKDINKIKITKKLN